MTAIEASEIEKENAEKEVIETSISNEELTATSLASIAASLEYKNIITLEDVEV